jgi:SagB-type dehydrogenase family enzyme
MNRKQCYSYFLLLVVSLTGECAGMSSTTTQPEASISLPQPDKTAGLPLHQALDSRRSHRDFVTRPLKLAEVSQLLWSAQGTTGSRGRRTAPSAGALYPLEIYLQVAAVEGIAPGTYHFDPKTHRLAMTQRGGQGEQLAQAALHQDYLEDAPLVIVIAAVFARTEKKYGKRATRYVHIEAGNVAQNIYLQATSLSLGTVYVGAFNDAAVKEVLALSENVAPLGLLPVGYIR